MSYRVCRKTVIGEERAMKVAKHHHALSGDRGEIGKWVKKEDTRDRSTEIVLAIASLFFFGIFFYCLYQIWCDPVVHQAFW